jgi:hypothetical protein
VDNFTKRYFDYEHHQPEIPKESIRNDEFNLTDINLNALKLAENVDNQYDHQIYQELNDLKIENSDKKMLADNSSKWPIRPPLQN